jgi:hypothetical protein
MRSMSRRRSNSHSSEIPLELEIVLLSILQHPIDSQRTFQEVCNTRLDESGNLLVAICTVPVTEERIQ